MPEPGGFFAGSIYGKLVLDTSGFNAALGAVDKSLHTAGAKVAKFGQSMVDAGKKMAGVGRNMTMWVTVPLAAVGGAALKLGMNAVESENLFEVSMGNMASSARAWSVELRKQFGLNEYEVRRNVGTFNVMLGSLGLNEKAAYGMAKGLTQLTYDMSSFYNLRPEEAFEKLQAGISGEIEPLKRLGIVVNETTTKNWALKNGLIAQGQEMTEQQKVVARYNVIMEQTGKAQGDLARTIESPANQLKILKQQAQMMGIELGQRLIPVMRTVMDVVEKGLKWWDGLSDKNKDLIIKFGLVAAAAGPVIGAAGKLLQIFGGLTKGIGMAIGGIGKLAGALNLGLVAWGAAAAAIGYYIIKLHEKGQAEEYAAQAEARAAKRLGEYQDKLYGIVSAVGVSKEKWAELTAKYGDNANALRKAILAGEAGTEAQKALADHTAKTTKESEKATTQTDAYNLSLSDLASGLSTTTEKQKTFSEYLKDAGVKSLADESAEVVKLYGYLDQLNKLHDSGKMSNEAYSKGVQQIASDLEDLGQKTNIVLPPARDFNDLIKQAVAPTEDMAHAIEYSAEVIQWWADRLGVSTTELKMYIYEVARLQAALMGIQLPSIDWSQFTGGARTATEQTHDYLAGLWNDTARGFGEAVTGILFEGNSLKEGWNGILGSMKSALSNAVGEMLTTWISGFIKKAIAGGADLLSGVKQTLGGIASNVGGIASGLGTSLATGIGAAVGTFLGSLLGKVFGGGPSGHQQQQQINDIKDSRNFLADIKNWFFSAGSGFGGAAYEFVTGHLGDWLTWIKDSQDLTRTVLHNDLAAVNKSIQGISGAQHGAVARGTGLVMVHGTPSRPEYIIPAPDLQKMVSGLRTDRGGKPSVVNVKNEVNVPGQIITDRDYVRGRLLPEIIAALRSAISRPELQAALGIK